MKNERYLIVFLLIVATIVLSFFVPPFIAASLIPAVAFGSILLGNPRLFLYIYLGVMGIYPLLKEVAPIGPVRYLNELMGAVLFGMFIAHLAFRRIEFRLAKRWGSIVVALIGYVFITWLMNRGSIRAATQCLFTYFSFIPFYLLSLKYLTRKDTRILIIGTFMFFWLNFGLNITWRLGINPLYNLHRAFGNLVDSDIGLFNGCNYVAYFCAMFLFLLISLLRDDRILGKKWRLLVMVTLVAVLFQLYMTFTNHAYIFLCMAFVPYVLISGIWKRAYSLIVIGAVVLVVGLAMMFSEEVQNQFSVENFHYRYDRFSYSAKAQLFDDLLVKNRRSNPVEWMFGVGPGNGMGPIGKNNLTPFALKMLLQYYQGDSRIGRSEMQMTSITGNTTSAIFTLWGDFGLIGSFLFCSLYVFLVSQSLRVIGMRKKQQGVVIPEFLVGAVAMFAITNIVLDVIGFVFFTCWIWMFAALQNLPEEDMESQGDILEIETPESPGIGCS